LGHYVLELFGHEFRLTDEMFATVLMKLQTRKFDLIVMSTTVRKLARFFLGSTTEKVIAHSRVPVFAIPREQ
jgi:nucleotide-binding universal stress UspA family protein